MLDSFADSKQCLQELASLCEFDLVNGPYITGSFMTWQLEIKYHGSIPNWLPDDLDICCTCEDQFQDVKKILQPLATTTKETNWLNHSATYWTINNFKYQAFVHPVSVQERLDIVDYTITAIASDGINCITGKYTQEDIVNRVIRLNDNVYRWPWPVESMMGRYKKYLTRGYKDIDNATLSRLNQIYETRTN
jgi:hypothetical protein